MASFARVSRTFFVILIPFLFATEILGQDNDTVDLRAGTGIIRLECTIKDYSGNGLIITRQGRAPETYPAEKVVAVSTVHVPKMVEAEKAYAAGRLSEAQSLYLAALDQETRPWVKSFITARLVRVYAMRGLFAEAGAGFEALLRQDLKTPYFHVIPLPWQNQQASPSVEVAARRWITFQHPAIILMGAANLITSNQDRANAIARLRELSSARDPRIAQLARAQLWRNMLDIPTKETVDIWTKSAEQMEPWSAAGPFFVIGLANRRLGRPADAALAFLRIPILYPNNRRLAAAALVEAARTFESIDRRRAIALLQEMIRTYPDQTRPQAEAKQLVEQWQ